MIKKKDIFIVRGRDDENNFDNTGHPVIILHDCLDEHIEFINTDKHYYNQKSYTDDFILIIRGTRNVLDDAGESTKITLEKLTYFYTNKVHLLNKDADKEVTSNNQYGKEKRLKKLDVILTDEKYQKIIKFIINNHDKTQIKTIIVPYLDKKR